MVIVGLEAAVHLTEEKKGKSVKKEVAATTELCGVTWAECSFHSGKRQNSHQENCTALSRVGNYCVEEESSRC